MVIIVNLCYIDDSKSTLIKGHAHTGEKPYTCGSLLNISYEKYSFFMILGYYFRLLLSIWWSYVYIIRQDRFHTVEKTIQVWYLANISNLP